MIKTKTTILAVSVVICMMAFAGIVSSQSMQQPVLKSKVTMADIDEALKSGPVFLEFETQECGYCKQQRPMTEELAGEYSGKVTFMFIDANQNRDIARTFLVSGVPQMNIIAKKENGEYTYVGKDGKASGNINDSRFRGLTQKDTLKTALDAAVNMRG
ncbi:thiol reductase thioredoxin [Methanocella sp. CWC-04]|uniref:Thiol reductase thioredoxin n=1 Tax=Methanooceanicella nereidis TaxID=2052831 RepID=A0AAP2RA95_9EURY|nr:thioredoxin family protein [Methanocella sp. CWC-04]MCD1293409.1 thiol reductase thioredoxin [Methanocella sp. CWC-04]